MGYVQTDRYDGYDYLAEKPGIVLVGCLAYSWRKFHEALKSDRARAEAALKKFGSIYATEKSIRKTTKQVKINTL